MRQAQRGALLVLMIAAAGCRHSVDLTQPATQDNFGVQMARSNLWREAMFRFQRAVDLDPKSAVAHNNLAVAYEANGDYDNAQKEYREALRLDRSNQYIQKNYSRFVEFLSRNKKRQQRQTAAAPKETTAASEASASQPAATSSAPAGAAPAAATSTAPPASPSSTSTAPPPPTPPAEKPPAGGF